jgi:uracil-DNA glycosylase
MNCGAGGSSADAPPPRPSSAAREREFNAPSPAQRVGEGVFPLDALATEIRACRVCAAHLPLGPRPVFRASPTARLLIASQAPGTKVHETGLSFNDPSGDRLRAWLQMDRDTFYDEARVAIVPMGFCYPGRLPNGGDAPPRPECAPLWRKRLLALMPEVRLTLLVGGYALAHVLGRGAMTAQVRNFSAHLPRYFALPHPSWRTTGWERRNPWFAGEVLPALRRAVAGALGNEAGEDLESHEIASALRASQ